MSVVLRFECAVRPEFDAEGAKLSRRVGMRVRKVDVYWVRAPEAAAPAAKDALARIFRDPQLHSPETSYAGVGIERRLLPGMTDNRSRTLKEAIAIAAPEIDAEALEVRSGDLYVLADATTDDAERIARAFLANPYIHEYEVHAAGSLTDSARFAPEAGVSIFRRPPAAEIRVRTYPVRAASDAELARMGAENLWSLTADELRAVQAYFRERDRDPTDAEMEMIAQTWSEHCSHKLFKAEIRYETETPAEDRALGIPLAAGSSVATVDGLFRETIARTTDDLPKPWLRSVFRDNAGIVQFSAEESVCLKVETHNSPSALDPFGGAITGIVGVNRDILGCGYGARPILNTNVFCVGDLDTPASALPEKLHTPRDLLEGVRSGVEAGGNQSGIPTVNGAICVDPSYAGKPLVYVGTAGVMPNAVAGRACEEKEIRAGDLVAMVGGRVGRDGIHGATFSSVELTEGMPSSVVQLGDPITQKRVADFLLEARDRGLFRTVTDNGAGGLSSSVGELAQLSDGATIDLRAAKAKVPGLQPWEILVSESQERMTFAVPPENRDAFEALATARGAEVSWIGTFHGGGKIVARYGERECLSLDLRFLHKGAPRLRLDARWDKPAAGARAPSASAQASVPETLKRLLALPNVASKESIIRQYDHEVQGASVVKPLTTRAGRSSPGDSGVVRLRPDSEVGVAIACGLRPGLSRHDAALMAQAGVDEAVRNLLCVGAEYSSTDPEQVLALVDNFCWPDPASKPEIAADLVRACFGLRAAALKLRAPLISGKDSMKNNYKGVLRDGSPFEVAVVPTLLMSALGRVADESRVRSSEWKRSGDAVYLVGDFERGLAATEWEKLGMASETLAVARPDWDRAIPLYDWLGSADSRILRSLHDISEGGLLVALAEACFARGLGLRLDVEASESPASLFGEGFHGFVGSVAREDAAGFEAALAARGTPFRRLGEVQARSSIEANGWSVDVAECERIWRTALGVAGEGARV